MSLSCVIPPLTTRVIVTPQNLELCLPEICIRTLPWLPLLFKGLCGGAKQRLICVEKSDALSTFLSDLCTVKRKYFLAGSFWLHVRFAGGKKKKFSQYKEEVMLISAPWQILVVERWFQAGLSLLPFLCSWCSTLGQNNWWKITCIEELNTALKCQ